MNIKQAKEEIKNTVLAYLLKDGTGEYKIPVIRQRPILLIGPPGIGKTQIMEQIARECKIALVSYTMTHHTRQSAVGLPFIRQEEFSGKEYSVTEYTMSEIIASIYRKMKDSGLSQGILFLDEINCVSETLAPAMLQFLQCKTFGGHGVPSGWIIVAAGNPPEYNKSVKEFDLVTLDRIRYISLEEDYSVWREYAREKRVHPAILGYLELRSKNFYRIEADVEGMQYVTARGWEDFSSLLYVYDSLGLTVDEEIVYEYLHHRDVAEDVAAYVDLYRKYEDDYGIEDILKGKVRANLYARIDRAAFDERLTVVNLLLDGLMQFFYKFGEEKKLAEEYYVFLKKYREELDVLRKMVSFGEVFLPGTLYEKLTKEWEDLYRKEELAGLHTAKENFLHKKLSGMIKTHAPSDSVGEGRLAFEEAKAGFDNQREKLEDAKSKARQALEYAFDFVEEVFLRGEEMLVFVTELTLAKPAAEFLLEYECKRYQTYSRELLTGREKGELLREIKR